MAKNISRKELKQPDEFVSFWHKLYVQGGAFLKAHRKPLLVGTGAAVAVIGMSLAMVTVREHKTEAASQALEQVQKIASAELKTGDDQPKQPDEAEAAQPIDDKTPRFKTERERSEATLKEVQKFLSSFGDSSLRDEALLIKGATELRLGKADDAIATYKQALASKLDKRVRFLAGEGLGYAHEAKGDVPGAIAAFDKLAADAGADGFYRDWALYQKARLTERSGNPKAAVAIYKEVLEKTPTTPLREEISHRLALLESP